MATQKLSVDRDLCKAHGNCYAGSPDLFCPDEYGFAITLRSDVGVEHAESAQRAVDGCPEHAITLDATA
jgi:ferredoxin